MARPAKIVLGVVGVTVVGGLAISSYSQINEGKRGVVTTQGAFSRVEMPGPVLKLPIFQGVDEYSVEADQRTLSGMAVTTEDNQNLYDVSITAQFRLRDDEQSIKLYHERFKTNFNNIMLNKIQSATKTVLGRRNAVNVGIERAAIETEIANVLRRELEAEGVPVIITKANFDTFSYDPKFKDSIEANAAAKQEQTRARAQLERDRIEAERSVVNATAQADAAIQTARGRAESQKLEADAQAYATREQGEASADALTVQAQALGSPEALVELEKARRWNGEVPAIVAGEGGNGMLIDLRSAGAVRGASPAPR